MINGYEDRRKANDASLSYFVAHLLNMSGKSSKRIIKPMEIFEGLHGREQKPKLSESDKERIRREFAWKLKGGE